MDRNELKSKAVNAAVTYLEHIGERVIDRDYQTPAGVIDAVVQDEYGLRFVGVSVSMYEIPDDPIITRPYRKRCESKASFWLNERLSDFPDLEPPVQLDFDHVSIGVFGESRAILRHHRGILQAPTPEALDMDAPVEAYQDNL